MRHREAFPWKIVSTSLKLCFANLDFKTTQLWGKHSALYALPGSTVDMKQGEAAVDKYGIAALHLPVAPPAIVLEPTCTIQNSPWSALTCSRWCAGVTPVWQCSCFLPSLLPSVGLIPVIWEGPEMRSAQLPSSLADERTGGEQSAPPHDPCVYGTFPVKSMCFRQLLNAKGCWL